MPAPAITFVIIAADSLIVACIALDWLAERRIHPVFAWVGSAIILAHIAEALLFDTPPWRAPARTILDALT